MNQLYVEGVHKYVCGDLAEGMVVLCLGGVINMLAIMFSVLTYDIVRGKGRKYVRVGCVVGSKLGMCRSSALGVHVWRSLNRA